MKVSKVVAIVKRAKYAVIYREKGKDGKYFGSQWLGDGAATYCLDGTPIIKEEEEFYKLYDIKPKNDSVFRFEKLPDFFSFDRWDSGGTMNAEPVKMTIGVENDVFRAFSFNGELVFVSVRYLELFGDDDSLTYGVRRLEDGTPFLCVFDGISLEAVIFPADFNEAKRVAIRDNLRMMIRELERRMAMDRLRVDKVEEEQISM